MSKVLQDPRRDVIRSRSYPRLNFEQRCLGLLDTECKDSGKWLINVKDVMIRSEPGHILTDRHQECVDGRQGLQVALCVTVSQALRFRHTPEDVPLLNWSASNAITVVITVTK